MIFLVLMEYLKISLKSPCSSFLVIYWIFLEHPSYLGQQRIFLINGRPWLSFQNEEKAAGLFANKEK